MTITGSERAILNRGQPLKRRPDMPPAELMSEPIAKRGAEYVELRGKDEAAQAEVRRLEGELEPAARRDIEAGARALRAGKRDPGRVEEGKVRDELEAARRHAEIAKLACDGAVVDLVEAVDTGRADWLAELETERSAAVARIVEAVERVSSDVGELETIAATIGWARSFPNVKRFRVASSGVRESLADGARTLEELGRVREERPLVVRNEPEDDEEVVEA